MIELDKEVIKSKKFRNQNPNFNPNKVCYYVGQTAHCPDVRFKQHKLGYKSNSYVRKYGLSLCKRKYKKFNPIKTREKAEKIERELTEKLRRKGHGVWSN